MFYIGNTRYSGYKEVRNNYLVGISITPNYTEDLNVGSTLQLSAVGYYDDGHTVNFTNQGTWSSGSTGIATVNSSGLVTGVAEGPVVISYTVNGFSGWSVIHVKQSIPVGRTFTVGTGSGTLEVNAASGPWAPIQPNDTFIIQGGTYDYVLFQGFNLTSGNVYVTCTSTVTLTGYGFYLSGSNKNIVCDFLNKVSGQKYGLVVDNWDHGVTIDENSVGNYRNVTIKGVRVAGVGNGKRVVNHAPPAYTGGNPSSENLVIEDWLVELPNSATPYLGIALGGDPFTAAYSRLNINPVIRRVEFKGTWQTQYPCFISNAQNGLIQQVTFDGTNQQVTANLHARLAMIHGQGTIEQVFAKNHMGNAAGFWGYYRTGQPNLCIARNILAQNSTRYSAVEVQGFADYNQSGVGANASYYIGGITADTLDTENYFTGCAADVYATFGGAVAVNNAISVNGHSNTSGGNNVINSYNENTITPTGSGVYADRAAAGLNTDLVPQTGSVLIGAGVANANLTTDYAGKTRANPPTRGGLEP